jgi:N-acetylmuramic acid 6-phosphate etherase
VLNTISTVTMIRLARTYGGLMVGVTRGNAKLRDRARRNVVVASGASEKQVDEALEAAAGDARVALVSLLAGVDADAARARLELSDGSVRRASGRRLDGARPGAKGAASPPPERKQQ